MEGRGGGSDNAQSLLKLRGAKDAVIMSSRRNLRKCIPKRSLIAVVEYRLPAQRSVGFFEASYRLLSGNKLYYLLVLTPIALFSDQLQFSDSMSFAVCCAAIGTRRVSGDSRRGPHQRS